MKSFEKFIEENYKGFNFISIASEAFVPGVILNDDDRIVDSIQRVFSEVNEAKWSKKVINASMPSEVISGERKLDLGVSLLGLFSLKGGFDANFTVSFEFNEVSEMVFDTANGGIYENEIRKLIMDLKHSDRDLWKSILHEHVVMEVIIVKSAIVEFKRNGKVIGEAEIEKIKNSISINGTYSWNSSGKMIVTNDKKLPFGVMDFQIKRYM
jgi:hypothetical protein